MDTGTLWSAQIQGIWTLYASRLLRFDAHYDVMSRKSRIPVTQESG